MELSAQGLGLDTEIMTMVISQDIWGHGTLDQVCVCSPLVQHENGGLWLCDTWHLARTTHGVICNSWKHTIRY